jgi:hypothetical protein
MVLISGNQVYLFSLQKLQVSTKGDWLGVLAFTHCHKLHGVRLVHRKLLKLFVEGLVLDALCLAVFTRVV